MRPRRFEQKQNGLQGSRRTNVKVKVCNVPVPSKVVARRCQVSGRPIYNGAYVMQTQSICIRGTPGRCEDNKAIHRSSIHKSRVLALLWLGLFLLCVQMHGKGTCIHRSRCAEFLAPFSDVILYAR